MAEINSHPKPRPSKAARVLLFLAKVLLAAFVVAVCAWFAVSHALKTGIQRAERDASALAVRLREKFVSAFQFSPQIVSGSKTLQVQSAEKLQLVTSETRIVQDYEWSHQWMGSTKRFEIEGTFVARAGFDLAKPVVIEIDTVRQTIRAILPSPEILTCEMSDLRVRRDEDGFWNKLTPAERNDVIQRLQMAGRHRASLTAVVAEAREAAENRLRELLEPFARKATIEFSTPGEDRIPKGPAD